MTLRREPSLQRITTSIGSKSVFSLDAFADTQVDELVTGLLKVFEYYSDKNIYSFNASLTFGPEGQEYFPCHFRIIARTFLNTREYVPDMNFFQSLLAEPLCVFLPEELCKELKKLY